MFRNESGQVDLVWIVGIGITIAIASISGWVAQSSRTDVKIDGVKVQVSATETNIAILQTESKQYRQDITSINEKLDKILQRLK